MLKKNETWKKKVFFKTNKINFVLNALQLKKTQKKRINVGFAKRTHNKTK